MKKLLFLVAMSLLACTPIAEKVPLAEDCRLTEGLRMSLLCNGGSADSRLSAIFENRGDNMIVICLGIRLAKGPSFSGCFFELKDGEDNHHVQPWSIAHTGEASRYFVTLPPGAKYEVPLWNLFLIETCSSANLDLVKARLKYRGGIYVFGPKGEYRTNKIVASNWISCWYDKEHLRREPGLEMKSINADYSEIWNRFQCVGY